MTRVARHLLALAAAAALAGCDRPSDLPDAGLSRTEVEFRAPAGGGDPAAETVTIVNAGHGTLDVPAVTIAYQEGKDWLEALVSGSAAPYVVSLRAATGALAEGTYHATVKLSWRDGSAQLSVALVVPKGAGGVPVMALSRTEVGFEAPGASGEPAAENVYVVNEGRGALPAPVAKISYQRGGDWLTADVSVTGAPYTVTLGAATAGLDPGVYAATVTLTCDGASASPAQVSVTLTVPGPSFTLSPRELAIDTPRGGADPAEATFEVLNAGRGVIPIPEVEASYAGGASGWLTTRVAPASGGGYAVAVQARVAGLPSGVHKATLTLRGAGGAVPPRTLPVTLTVPPPELVLSSHAVELVAPPGGVEVSGTVTVTNGGGGVLAAPVATVTYDGGAATSWDGLLHATVHGTTAPYTIELVARQTAGGIRLAPGTYTATVRVEASGAAAAEVVRVTLEVPTTRMQLSAPGVAFAEYTTCPLPAPATVRVVNTGGGTLAVPEVAIPPAAAAWLGASVVSGTADSHAITLALKAYPPVDAAGVATTTVEVVDPTGAAAPVSLAVRFDALPSDLSTASVTPARLDVWAQLGMGDPAPRTLSLRTPGGCFSPPAVAVAPAEASASASWLTVGEIATTPHRHDVAVLTSVAGLSAGDRRQATLQVQKDGRSWDVPVTLAAGQFAAAGPLVVVSSLGVLLGELTALADGRALLHGGFTGAIQAFDPATRTWATVGSPYRSRLEHGAVELDDGRVVVCGGWEPAGGMPVASCEICAWSSAQKQKMACAFAATLMTGRSDVTLATMSRNRVLIVSGDSAVPEVLDLSTGRSSLLQGVSGTAAVKRPDGSILLAGGTGTSWLYTPERDAWAPAGDLVYAHLLPALMPLPDGRVLALGPSESSAETFTQVWDPRRRTWSAAASSPHPYAISEFAALSSGKILATSDGSLSVFDPVTGAWSAAGTWAAAGTRTSLVRLSSGMVLFAGVWVPGAHGSYKAVTDTFTW